MDSWTHSPLSCGSVLLCTCSLSTVSGVEEETPGPWGGAEQIITINLLSLIISKERRMPDFTLHSCREINKTLLRTRAPYPFLDSDL